jgi:hypothetical protein
MVPDRFSTFGNTNIEDSARNGQLKIVNGTSAVPGNASLNGLSSSEVVGDQL